MDKEGIIRRLSELPYNREEFWVLSEAAKVMRGLRKRTGEIELGCMREVADAMEKDGYPVTYPVDEESTAEEPGGRRGNRRIDIGGDIVVQENLIIGGLMEEIDGFQVVDLSALQTIEEIKMRYMGLDPEKMRETESEHYIFHYKTGSFAERDIQKIAPMQDQIFRKICDVLRVEPDFPIHC